MSTKPKLARVLLAAFLLASVAGIAAPAFARTSTGNMIVVLCYDDGRYDCRPRCDYRICC